MDISIIELGVAMMVQTVILSKVTEVRLSGVIERMKSLESAIDRAHARIDTIPNPK